MQVPRPPLRTQNELFKNILNIYSQYGIINQIDGAVSSVRFAVSEEGPKNPLKGTPTNPLVFALNAQFGVDAGGRRVF